MKPMISKRCGHGSIVFQGQLWAVGGFNGDRYLRSVEQYSFVKGVQCTKINDFGFKSSFIVKDRIINHLGESTRQQVLTSKQFDLILLISSRLKVGFQSFFQVECEPRTQPLISGCR